MVDWGFPVGATSESIYFRLRDSTTGLPKTGLAFDSAGASASYVLKRAESVAITLVTLGSASAAYSSGGFIEVDAVKSKGLYRLDLPDAVIAARTYALVSLEFDGVIEETAQVEVGAFAVLEEALEDHLSQGTAGFAQMLMVYQGEYGPGIYCDSNASNTNTVAGTDGTEKNPVSTLAAARTLADAIGLRAYYIEDNSSFTLAATHEDWEFFGLGSVVDNTIDLGSQDVDRSVFVNLTIEGVQGGAERIELDRCAIQDVSGAGVTTLHVIAKETGFVDEFEIDTSNDNEFIDCFSQVAGTAAPIIIATGAAGTVAFRRYSGGIELKSLSASHNLSIEGMGQVIFNVNCNRNANVSIRGLFTITDNTAGMNNLTVGAVFNRAAVNAEADTALADYAGPTKAEMDTAHALLATPASILTTALTEAYAADGAEGTLSEILYAIQAFLQERSVSGTTVTVAQLDGSTTAMTFTLDDSVAPTSITRAS